jgi:hypothetical protein
LMFSPSRDFFLKKSAEIMGNRKRARFKKRIADTNTIRSHIDPSRLR